MTDEGKIGAPSYLVFKTIFFPIQLGRNCAADDSMNIIIIPTQLTFAYHGVAHLTTPAQTKLFTMRLNYELDKTTVICLYDVACGHNEKKESLFEKKNTNNSNFRCLLLQ